jgi:AcrR family transcriptional regulator
MTSGGARLPKTERREQLLDAAASIIVERGLAGITMERLAATAGVSKALPYAHFENADEVLAELYRREITQLGAAIVARVASADRGIDRLVAAMRAYFDFVEARGAILTVLAGAGSSPAEASDPDIGPNFVADLLVDSLGISRARAVPLAGVVLGALLGATSMWGRGVVSRKTAETSVIEFVVAGVTAVTNDSKGRSRSGSRKNAG